MSDPYRDAPSREVGEAPRDRGIVGDVIAQFADPYAFYRELIQNSIDAGSPDILVELRYDDSAQRMHASVRDRGDGMTRAIVENQLLVLFRSTKEKDPTKIGKFGIGFKSVLAPDPEVVVINTVRDGKRLTCHLYRDLSYDLFDGGRATQSGTTVEVELAMDAEQVTAFCTSSEAALRRWCRHASVPIEFVTQLGDERTSVRIDRPLDIADAIVEVKHVADDGQLIVLAGVTASATPYLGFFNHGLMLAQLDTEAIGNVSVKVQDSRLGHTLSRDNVRRDAHYAHAMSVVRKVIDDILPATAAARLRELADGGGGPKYRELLVALTRSKLPPASWHFPLLEPLGDVRSVAMTSLPGTVWGGVHSSAVTAALAAAGSYVLRVDDRAALDAALAHGSVQLRDADYAMTVATPVELVDRDSEMLGLLSDLLERVHRLPAGISLVTLSGARADLLAGALATVDTRLVDREDILKNPFALFGRRTLAISAAHPHVKAARAHPDPVLAAAHLARIVLSQYQLLDAARSRKILARTLSALGVRS